MHERARALHNNARAAVDVDVVVVAVCGVVAVRAVASGDRIAVRAL
jgi:hypothetical protein